VTFAITGVDDALIDATQSVILTASASGFADGTNTVHVVDDEIATLTITINMGSIGEAGGSATGTVTRHTGTVGDLLVTLASSDEGEASVPATVMIPNGQDSVTFAIAGVDDRIIDGTQTATITATADGFLIAGTDTIGVTDNDVAFVVDTLVDESDGHFSIGDVSLREAIELANELVAHPDAIEFDA